MATRPPVNVPQLSKRSRVLLVLGGIAVLALLAGTRLIDTYIDWLWFGEVDARSVFSTILLTRIGLFFSVGAVVGGIVALSLYLAYRTRPVFVPVSSEDDPLAKYRTTIIGRAKWFGIGIPAFIGIIAGATAQADWAMVRLFFGGTEFGETDPEFGLDVGFFAFSLPFYNWLVNLGLVASALAFIAAAVVHYVFGGIRFGTGMGRLGYFSSAAKVQLAITAGIFVLIKAVDYFLDRYDMLLSNRNDIFMGATYTDLHAVLPAKLILTSIAVFCALALFAGAVMRNLQLPAIALVLLLLSSVVVGAAWPALLERFAVQPNQIEREAESIERNMTATRHAYDLQDVEFHDYTGRTEASADEVAEEIGTIPNIRLLDPAVLERTFTQLAGRENYYGFPEILDIDRYEIDGEKQDFIVALKQIDPEGLTPAQGSWINRHMVYTHGNGFVAAPANRIDRALGGDDGSDGGFPVLGTSDTETPAGAHGIEVDQARIYYGELDHDYAIVGESGPGERSTNQEQDYVYTGEGGVPVDNLFHRAIFSAHYGERNFLFTGQIGDGSKILYKRDPTDRVRDIAPWLTVDGDPYPAVIDGEIKWIVDGYTTLDNYPYSQQQPLGEVIEDPITGLERPDQNTINYIRNSVKATVDAYDGTVTLYTKDPDDPVLEAWKNVFPDLVEPEEAISDELREHFRYPSDMFKVQRELLTRYHVESPREFYTTNEFWDVPPDPTVEDEPEQPPYYIMAETPGFEEPTFQLTSPLTPLRRQYLSAWMSVSSDPETYGEMHVLRLPSTDETQQTEGPIQVQNRFESDPDVAQDRTLFDNPNIDVIYGNQLTLPVAGGFLYVEPVYIEQTREHAFPQLARVLVAFGDRVGFHPTLEGAMEQVFGEGITDVVTTPVEGDADVDLPDVRDEDEEPAEDADEVDEAPAQVEGMTAEMEQAAADMQAAWARYQEAQSNGDFAEQGDALTELDEAAQRYEEAKNNAEAGDDDVQPGG
ncbi:UPF0182 family protein [Haloechinothrix sp. LS1_15]|uniref:UPF0182 family membrane protein n=1 Tax=Haloechinothrix sp. LS1_15 TaxID=2652248 RepID=UPI002945331F|nr:UPF0182 family protein [Haloechinothrix sp. LS1_15]MDV6014574.1 UPF0182 family protein [Haloechinothrix sp. LS1_15]